MQRTRLSAVLLALAVSVAACATSGSVRDSRGEGVTHFYEAELDTLWAAALHAVRANGLRLDEKDEYERYIVATHPPRRPGRDMDDERVVVDADQGERIGIFVDSAGPGTWAVEVVTRRTFALDPGKTSWAEDVFWVIERDLGASSRVDREAASPDSAGGG